MKAYKVVKRKRNGARVSVIVPDWHPCYTVYQRNGENIKARSAFAFQHLVDAIYWTTKQFNNAADINADLKDGEALEIWEIEYETPEDTAKMIDLWSFLIKSEFSGKTFSTVKKLCRGSKFDKLYNFLYNKIFLKNSVLIRGALIVSNMFLTKKLYSTPTEKIGHYGEKVNYISSEKIQKEIQSK